MQPTRSLVRRLLGGALLALGIATQALAGPLPGQGVTVQPLKSSLAEEAFQTLLVNRALEKLGYTVLPMKDLEPATEHLAIANGDATFTASHWHRLHASFYENSGGDAKLWRQGVYSDTDYSHRGRGPGRQVQEGLDGRRFHQAPQG